MSQVPPAKRSIIEVSALAEHYIVPVPKVQEGVCSVCHGVVYDGWRSCYLCNEAKRLLVDLALDGVSFISLAPVGEQFARELYAYKRPNVPIRFRQQRSVLIAAVLWRWLERHEPCLARAAGLADGRFDLIASVPSTSGRREVHPLETVIGGVVAGSSERYRGLLRLSRDDLPPREVARDRFVATSPLPGKTVLLIDDTWTTGAKMQSASAALKIGGATNVGGVAIGRWFKNGYRQNAEWLRKARAVDWSWDTCCVE
jgi:hypothetical protein